MCIRDRYLNVIEMGDGIYGAEAAAQKYFHKPAKDLSRAEAAAIAAVLPNPRKWHPDRPTPYISRKIAWIPVSYTHLDVYKRQFNMFRGERSPALHHVFILVSYSDKITHAYEFRSG